MLLKDFLDLINKAGADEATKNIIKVYFDIKNLRINLRDQDNNLYQVSDLSYDHTLQELNEKIKNLNS